MKNINEIHMKMRSLLNDSSVGAEQLMPRLIILKTYLEMENINVVNRKFIGKYQEIARRFSNIADDICLGEEVDSNINLLRNYIFNSDFCKSLKENKIVISSISDLEWHAYKYSGDRIYVAKLTDAVNLYQLLVTIKMNEDKKKKIVYKGMSKILQDDLLKEYDEVTAQRGRGFFRSIYKRILKRKDNYESNRRLAFRKLMNLYLKDGLLDVDTFQCAMKMTTDIFESYIYPDLRISFMSNNKNKEKVKR